MTDNPTTVATTVSEASNGSSNSHTGAVQVQVIPTQIGINTSSGSSTSVLSNPGSLLTAMGSTQDLSSAQLTQLGLSNLPVEQQQKLLLAAQLRQLSKTAPSGNTSFVIQPTFQVVSSSAPTTTTSNQGKG